MNKPQKNKHVDIENRVVMGEGKKVKGVNCAVTDGSYIFGGEHMVGSTEEEIQCARETCIIS